MRFLVGLAAVAVCATSAWGSGRPDIFGRIHRSECPYLIAVFNNPSPTVLLVLRTKPRDADDFLRNYSKCRTRSNVMGWHRADAKNCQVVNEVYNFMRKHDVAITGAKQRSVGFGFWGTRSGNIADLGNNAKDCLRMGFGNHAGGQVQSPPTSWRGGNQFRSSPASWERAAQSAEPPTLATSKVRNRLWAAAPAPVSPANTALVGLMEGPAIRQVPPRRMEYHDDRSPAWLQPAEQSVHVRTNSPVPQAAPVRDNKLKGFFY